MEFRSNTGNRKTKIKVTQGQRKETMNDKRRKCGRGRNLRKKRKMDKKKEEHKIKVNKCERKRRMDGQRGWVL